MKRGDLGVFYGLRNALIIELVLAAVLFLGYRAAFGQTSTVDVQFEHAGEPDLAGFNLYWGTASGTYTESRAILIGAYVSPPEWMTLPIALDPGTYYFAATAYDTSGHESGYSNEAELTVTDVAPGEPQDIRYRIVLPDGTEVIFEVNIP